MKDEALGEELVAGDGTELGVGVPATSECPELAVGGVEPQAASPTAASNMTAREAERPRANGDFRRRARANVNDTFTFG